MTYTGLKQKMEILLGITSEQRSLKDMFDDAKELSFQMDTTQLHTYERASAVTHLVNYIQQEQDKKGDPE